MKINRPIFLNIALALLIATGIFILSEKGALKRIELSGLDLMFRLRGNLPVNPHIVIVEITDDDISRIGRWPWPRKWSAAMNQALTDLGAKTAYFDIIFSEASNEEDDALLEESIKLTQNTYLPFAFQSGPIDIKNTIMPLERFSRYLKGAGAVNIYPDIDGNIRRVPLVFRSEKEIFPHISLKVAMDYMGLQIEKIDRNHVHLVSSQGKVNIPLVAQDTMLINWLGKWQHTFKHYDFIDVLAAYKDLQENKEATGINLSDFKNSIAIVAVTAIGLYDIKPIPLQSAYPGVGVAATIISNILDKNFISTVPHQINTTLIYILALLSSFLIFGKKPLRETVFLFLIAGLYFIIAFILFKGGLYINFSVPLLALFTSHLTVETYNFVRVAIERRNFLKLAITDGLTGLYNVRYFKMILETEITLAKSDHHKVFSIIMGDVDHFKHFNDTYGHQVGDLVLKEIASVLKSSVRASDIVARYGGEETIILLRGTDLKGALVIAEKIRKNIEEHIIKDHCGIYKVTSSFGVSVFRPEDSVDVIIKRADDGLYKAKEAGRNRISTIEE